jgi:hypothetical protein
MVLSVPLSIGAAFDEDGNVLLCLYSKSHEALVFLEEMKV